MYFWEKWHLLHPSVPPHRYACCEITHARPDFPKEQVKSTVQRMHIENDKQKVNPNWFFSQNPQESRQELGPPVRPWPVRRGWSEVRWEALGGATMLIKPPNWWREGEGEVPSESGQIGQHSPSGMMGSAQSDVSSQITSSHMMFPLSQTQIWHDSGFHTSLSLYNCPSNVQLPNVPEGSKINHSEFEHQTEKK